MLINFIRALLLATDVRITISSTNAALNELHLKHFARGSDLLGSRANLDVRKPRGADDR